MKPIPNKVVLADDEIYAFRNIERMYPPQYANSFIYVLSDPIWDAISDGRSREEMEEIGVFFNKELFLQLEEPFDKKIREWTGDGTGGDHNEEGIYYREVLVWEMDIPNQNLTPSRQIFNQWELDNIPRPE